MSQRISTAGMTLSYAVETTANSRPTTGYITVPEVKSMPSFNPAPNSIESTTLQETEYTTYVAGLKDLGGVLEFGANLTEDLITAWNTTLMGAYNTAQAETTPLNMWFCVSHPKLAEAVYFIGAPIPLSLNEAEVGSMAETTLYIAPQNEPELFAKSTT